MRRDSWRVVRVQELAELVNGYPFDSADFADSGDVPLVRIRDLLSRQFETFVRASAVPESVMTQNGDVIIGMDGDFNSTLWNRGPAALNQRLCLLRSRKDCDRRFLAYALPSHLKVINDLTYATTVKHLSSGQVRGIHLLVPAYGEQVAIADYLDRETAQIDDLIGKQEQLIDMLRERHVVGRAALAVQGPDTSAQLHPSPLFWAPEIPSHWPVVPLTAVARLESGHTPSRTQEGLWEDCHIPWVSLNDVGSMTSVEFINQTVNQISDAGIRASSARLLPAGTVVLSRDATIGRSAIMAVPMATSQHFADWVCGPDLDPHYLWLLFTSAMQPYFDSLTNGSTLRTIGRGSLRAFKVPLPPLHEQQVIVQRARERAAKADALIGKAERFIELARERRSALITAAVTGQIDVRPTSSSSVQEAV